MREGGTVPATVLRRYDEFGFPSVDLVNPPRRFWGDRDAPPSPAVETSVDARRVQPLPTPSGLLIDLPPDDNWPAQTRRTLARLWANYLVCEDPLRRLDARRVNTLAHQVSLVQHVLETDHLRRVLVADEVGLGKTVEAGLLIQHLLDQSPGLRVLYLAPARLVPNVRREFDRLGLHFRQWAAADSDARLTDPLIVASIHRAVHGAHFERVLGTVPWDVLIVDECHHLSDWAAGGGDPREKFRLVRELIARQQPGGRVIFLSGTPHQGHVSRFENLLGLLRVPGEPADALAGRVIYRTKEDVRDWDDNPLFPTRQVNVPFMIDLGPAYREWIQHIHEFFQPKPGDPGVSDARRRAAGWRCAQALQWATSSPHAGLGYLVRQAIRAGCDLADPTLAEAVAALRPYRRGAPDEPVADLFKRMARELAPQREEDAVEDIEDDEEREANLAYGKALAGLLAEGICLVRSSGDEKWAIIKRELLDKCDDEKVVLFAQPIETVTALAHFLERTTGTRPALIVGGQKDAERDAEVTAFWKSGGPRFLVSSRAGGEGINLQIARRLVHVDVPWNPMDMEQRVGRVHRFGSRRTIIVDTVVVSDSREGHAYRVARQRLELITRTLVKKERFEAVFARVMGLVPPEELQGVLIRSADGLLSDPDQDAIGRMVQAGFGAWQAFHDRFAERQKQIRRQNPGLATWSDVARFLAEYGNVETREGFRALRFTRSGDRVDPVEQPVAVVNLGGPEQYVCGEVGGAPVFGSDGTSAQQLGLNLPPVAEILRRLAFAGPAGAAVVRVPADRTVPGVDGAAPFGVLVFVRQTVRPDSRAGHVEVGVSLPCYVVTPGREPVVVEGPQKRELLYALFDATVARAKPDPADPVVAALRQHEDAVGNQLRRPSDPEMRSGVRHAVTPLLAALVLR
jgi:superfamily II DNA or RNA helicase